MKKKLGALLFSCLLVFLLASCDEVLSMVTCNESGEKVVHNYVSLMKDTVYNETVSLKTWHDIDFLKEADFGEMLFTIENKKENVVVLGDADKAAEIKFFDGGYKYTLFASLGDR